MTAGSRSERYPRFFQPVSQRLAQLGFGPAAVAESKNYRHWFTGRPRVRWSIAFAQDGFRVELAIEGSDFNQNRGLYEKLEGHRADLESVLSGLSLVWSAKEDRMAHRIYALRPGSIDTQPEELNELAEWAVDNMIRFRASFGPLL